jgi:hypothetical protein
MATFDLVELRALHGSDVGSKPTPALFLMRSSRVTMKLPPLCAFGSL